MSEDNIEDFKSYKQLSQFYNIVKDNEDYELSHWTIDKTRVNKELEIIIEQTGDINYQYPDGDFTKLCNPLLAGCTALHLAVCQKNETITKALFKRGIDLTIKNQRGLTALHTIVDRYYADYKNRWRMKGRLENKFVDMMLSAHVEYNVRENPYDEKGISHFHVACMANHSSAVEFFLSNGAQSVDQAVDDGDLLVFHGYTPLHFAVRCCALEVTEILIKYGADVTRKNANGMTPIDLLLEQNMAIVDLINAVDNTDYAWRYQISKLMSDLEINKKIMQLLLLRVGRLGDPLNFDGTGLSQLHLACTLEDISLMEAFLRQTEDINQCVKMDTPFWPGYTPLHFAAHFDIKIVRHLLRYGANIEAKDANGLTPFDICVERYNAENLRFILQSNSVWRDIILSDNKTKLLDVVGAMQDSNTLDNFFQDLQSDEVPRVPSDSPLWPGHTPLHLAIIVSETAKIITDYERKSHYANEDFDELEREYLKRIEVCLKHGADVTVQDTRGWTALHLAYRMQKAKVVELLLRQHTQIVNPVDTDHLSHAYIAKAFDYIRLAKQLLASDPSSVDVRIKATFQWPQRQKYFVRKNCKGSNFFVANDEADATPTNPKKNIPIYLSDQILSIYYDSLPSYQLMLKNFKLNVKDWSVNPTSIYGISHFHMACLNVDVDIMEKFLQSGVNVNQPVALYSSQFPGCAPLHLVLNPDTPADNDTRIEAIDLLLRYGADAHAGDLFDNSVLHAATKCCPPRNKIFEKILSTGININVKNVFGEVPLGTLMSSRKFEKDDVKFFLKHHCDLIIFEPIRQQGYLKMFFPINQSISKTVMKSPGITKIDDIGRNAIHNVVSWEYARSKSYPAVISLLMERGCDVDLRDTFGRTPLDLAVKFRNDKAVIGLLTAGADINKTNSKGNTAFSDVFSFSKNEKWHQFEFDYRLIFKSMAMHIYKLQILGLYVSELNTRVLDELLKKWSFDEEQIDKVNNELKKMKDLKIESTLLSPYEFFSETGAIAAFPYMPLSQQQAINTFFTSMKKRDFKQLGYLLKIRHNKTLKRLSLLKPASVSLNQLLRLTLPDKCSRHILRLLTNTDLENIITANELKCRRCT